MLIIPHILILDWLANNYRSIVTLLCTVKTISTSQVKVTKY
jgi:hypothetical protein